LNFTKLLKVVWIDLKEFYKIYKWNKKTEKEKEENKIKMETGRGNPFGPEEETAYGPGSYPEPVPSPFPSFSLPGGPHLSAPPSTSSRYSLLETVAVILPFNPHYSPAPSVTRPRL
jgi:hypothetical protein